LAIASFLLLSPPVTADLPQAPEDSVEANGRVWDILRVGDRIYLAGSFTQVTNTDGQTFVRNNLAAIDANTGKVVPDWDPNATRPASPSTSSVRAMALSSDGSRLFVGGTFANVGGLNRNRLAAVDVATGAVNKQWTSGVNNTV
jgi:trimeric autotransporter adhesin